MKSDWDLNEISATMGPLIHRVAKGVAAPKLKPIKKADGFNAWRVVCAWFSPRSTADSVIMRTYIMNPGARCKTIAEL